jgi:hypothetical protein
MYLRVRPGANPPVESCLVHKYYARLENHAREKHSSVLSNSLKSFITLVPGRILAELTILDHLAQVGAVLNFQVLERDVSLRPML